MTRKGNVIRVSAKGSDIILNPFNRRHLVKKTKIAANTLAVSNVGMIRTAFEKEDITVLEAVDLDT